MHTHIVYSAEDHKCLSADKKELEHLTLTLVLHIKKWKEVICKKRNGRDVEQNRDFLFDERLK